MEWNVTVPPKHTHKLILASLSYLWKHTQAPCRNIRSLFLHSFTKRRSRKECVVMVNLRGCSRLCTSTPIRSCLSEEDCKKGRESAKTHGGKTVERHASGEEIKQSISLIKRTKEAKKVLKLLLLFSFNVLPEGNEYQL